VDGVKEEECIAALVARYIYRPENIDKSGRAYPLYSNIQNVNRQKYRNTIII